MATTDDKPKKSEWFRATVRRCFDFVFTFKNKRGEVLDYKLSHVDGINFAPREFYALVENELVERNLPGVSVSHEKFAEGGLLSDQRVYLRIMRERFCLDTCAAPFGNVFFFSTRTVHVPALVRLWHILAALTFFFAVWRLLIFPLGFTFAGIALVALVFALVSVLRNASTGGFSDLDTLLRKIPVVATIYEDWFREETYYRQDTRNLYLTLLPERIQKLAEETCAVNGVKLVQHFQPTPPTFYLNPLPPPDSKPPAA